MTTPFDAESPAGPDHADEGRKKLRPWWRWNLITLAVVLFLVLWVRELAGLPLSRTWGMVCAALLIWWLTPSVVLRKLPWPLSLFAYMEVAGGDRLQGHGRSHAGRACRVFAVLIALGGCYQVLMGIGWMIQGGGYYGGAAFSVLTRVVNSSFFGALYAFGLSAGLWTIGSIALAIDRQAANERTRSPNDAGAASGPQG